MCRAAAPPTLRRMSKERRCQPRQTVTVPVTIGDGGRGTTRDVSATGVFLETDWGQAIAPLLDLEFALDVPPAAALRFVVQGSVVRREPRGPRQGVAVRLLTMRVHPLA
jgi:hypothetical protein